MSGAVCIAWPFAGRELNRSQTDRRIRGFPLLGTRVAGVRAMRPQTRPLHSTLEIPDSELIAVVQDPNSAAFETRIMHSDVSDLVRQLTGELENFEEIAKCLIPQPGDVPKL